MLLLLLTLNTLSVSSILAVDFLDILKGDGFSGTNSNKRLIVHRVGQCPGKKNLPIYFPDFRVAQFNRTTHVVSGEIVFHEDFPNGWTTLATVKKCDDFKTTASCRPFLNNIANANACTLLAASEAVYYRLMSKIEPKVQCPFRKGTYVLAEQPVEHELTRYLPGTGSTYWEVTAMGKVEDRMVLCFIIQLNAKPVKTKQS